MAGSALSAVQSQIANLQSYASAAVSSANSALSSLANLELTTAYPTEYSFDGPNFTPTLGSDPGNLSVGSPPPISNISLPAKPTRPSMSSITTPQVIVLSLPQLPSIQVPSIDTTSPTYSTLQPKSWNFSVSDIIITDDPMIQAVIDRLTANIQTGGTGLSAAVEAAIWARGVEREEQQLDDSVDKATTMWAKKGFSLPDGQLADSLMALQTEYLNRKLDRSREIEIKQAELEQANLFKSMELAVNLASTLINMLIRYEELVFKGQEATAKFANEYIDLQIKSYMANVETYKARAQIGAELVRAELAKAEIYKAEIDGQSAIADINLKNAQVYAEMVRGNALLVEAYKADVQAMLAEAEANKAIIESNRLALDGWAKGVDAQISAYNANVERYKAVSLIEISAAEMLSKQSEANMRAAIAAVEVSVKSFEVSERSNNLKAQISMEAAKGVAQATASMAAGAMAAMSAHAGMTYSESMSLEEA